MKEKGQLPAPAGDGLADAALGAVALFLQVPVAGLCSPCCVHTPCLVMSVVESVNTVRDGALLFSFCLSKAKQAFHTKYHWWRIFPAKECTSSPLALKSQSSSICM